MGQTIGRATVPDICKRLVNLPAALVKDIWEAFNDIAEGFGLSIEEVKEIMKLSLLNHFMLTERVINKEAEACFRILDDDEVITLLYNLYLICYNFVITFRIALLIH
jgi:hypothetical protein